MTQVLSPSKLARFVRESNAIEGIDREPTDEEIEAILAFLKLKRPLIANLEQLVRVYQPGARLRDRPGLDARVGTHFPPNGGEHIFTELQEILAALSDSDPWETHVRYETLHPFTDGNGRSGRALWAWQMVRRQEGLPLGFLHQWYYGTLERGRANR